MKLGGHAYSEDHARDGVFLMVEADSERAACAFVREDPYGKAQLYDEVVSCRLALEIGTI